MLVARGAQARLLDAFTSQPSYNDAASNADFGLVTLAEAVGDVAGWMGFEYPAAGSQTVDLTTAGEVVLRSEKQAEAIAVWRSKKTADCSPQRMPTVNFRSTHGARTLTVTITLHPSLGNDGLSAELIWSDPSIPGAEPER